MTRHLVLGVLLFLGILSGITPVFGGSVKGVVILIPGTMNSVSPGNIQFDPISHELEVNPYFSAEIQGTIEAQGFSTYVVKNLGPTASFESNGQRALDELRDWYVSRFPAQDVPIYLLGHSAGGFYGLYVASHAGALPIRALLTVATPWEGSELADRSFQIPLIGRASEGLIDHVSDILDLRGLPELKTDRVRSFLSSVRAPAQLKIIASVGQESPPPTFFEALDCRYLSPLFILTSSLIGGDSDGLISAASGTGADAGIQDRTGRSMKIRPFRSAVPLDHTELVLDYRIFKLLGRTQTTFIRDVQRNFYARLISDASSLTQ